MTPDQRVSVTADNLPLRCLWVAGTSPAMTMIIE